MENISIGIYIIGDWLWLETIEAIKDLNVVLPQSTLHDQFNVQPSLDDRYWFHGFPIQTIHYFIIYQMSDKGQNEN